MKATNIDRLIEVSIGYKNEALPSIIRVVNFFFLYILTHECQFNNSGHYCEIHVKSEKHAGQHRTRTQPNYSPNPEDAHNMHREAQCMT